MNDDQRPMTPVASLRELESHAAQDQRYGQIAAHVAGLLGHDAAAPSQAVDRLYDTASTSGEDPLVEAVNRAIEKRAS